ncbi:LuxR family transcriptional regulator [Salipiger aestuarii]|uniref:DNA-binding CsgD family transcriptional regulator n=1 Tax=Salipiger aestuarii TaxID=568098 RepID=A0A327YSI8_9RHOB|nr:autoinducer binding domain-containing protein [Salipiger aestuarii]EIE51182.1 autoinducer-binding transcriptional regulator LuxR [Citreicella sp. 357]KAA8610204.1 LuxR family transcriptional regulator [Salipiger aestuarii]KAA8615986.1 LuxR family transcriptional regulator [Salipiger aestuarii]KAB2543404.1 LuxR family transcriptional regulator [Salipiger aestuarii]RAK23920.1 DNA-binding CsgD family transcriptional regulator [Salipiger aestuarii]
MGFAANFPGTDGLLEQLENSSKPEDFQEVSVALRDHYAIAHLVYHWVSADGEQFGCGTYDPVWVQRYVEKGYLRIDPVIQGCYQRFHPVDWKRLDWSSKAARAFQKDAIGHGVGNQGYSIPIRGPNGQFALFSLSHNCNDETWQLFTESNRRELILISHAFNQKALELEPGRKPEPAQPLSPREVEAMTLLAVGYSRAQVAETLSISEHTLRVYIESARFKLGAMNTTHAVARALSRGLIVV